MQISFAPGNLWMKRRLIILGLIHHKFKVGIIEQVKGGLFANIPPEAETFLKEWDPANSIFYSKMHSL